MNSNKTTLEATRTRKEGTHVFLCETYAEVINAARHVTENGYAKVNGEMLDATTANMLTTIDGKLNEKNRDATCRMFLRIRDQAIAAGAGTEGKAPALQVALRHLVNFFWKFVR